MAQLLSWGYFLRANMPKAGAIGIDIGGTKTLCILTDSKCRIVHQVKYKSAPNEGTVRFKRELTEALEVLRRKAKSSRIDLIGIGIGCAGQVDRHNAVIVKSPNLMALEGLEIGKLLQRTVDVPVLLRNDVRMGVYGEYKIGAAKGSATVIGVFFGTGVGSAAIVNHFVFEGASGMGGQVGAVLAQPVGGSQATLSHGIIDRIAGKAAIASEALVMAVKEWAPYLHRKVGSDISKVTWGMLRRAIEHGDQQVEEMLCGRLRVVGIALSNVVNFLNPEVLVLGGGLVGTFPKLVKRELETGLREHLVPEVSSALKVKLASLGGEAVALGSAYAALEEFGAHKQV